MCDFASSSIFASKGEENTNRLISIQRVLNAKRVGQDELRIISIHVD